LFIQSQKVRREEFLVPVKMVVGINIKQADGFAVRLLKYEAPIAGDVNTPLISAHTGQLMVVEEWVKGV